MKIQFVMLGLCSNCLKLNFLVGGGPIVCLGGGGGVQMPPLKFLKKIAFNRN